MDYEFPRVLEVKKGSAIMKKVISLGMNCEVSFQIERYVEHWNSSLFSWAFILDDEKFFKALDNIDDILNNKISFARQTDDMFLDEKYQITFHGRISREELFDEEWNIKNNELYENTISELRMRIDHLKNKFKEDLESDAEKIYLRKLEVPIGDKNKVRKFSERLYEYLMKNIPSGNFKLIIIIEDKNYDITFQELENDKLFIRTISFFAPVSDTKNGADNAGYKKIFKEFVGEEKG